ncbi:hypothetical protein BGW42_001855 [Actinomortierella wolfii]|nr:hypothetical protein BGW42_001855 [Actinomortierella wolfii]
MSTKRTTDPGEGSSSGYAKRVRFGRDNDDSPQSFEEIDDSDLLEKRKRRRGAVNLAGFGEDENSSDEEGGSFGRKGKGKDDDDNDDDMFGDNNKKKRGDDKGDDEEDDINANHEYAEFVEKEKIARWKDKKGRASGSGFDKSEIEGEATIEDADQEYDSEGNPTIEAFNMRTEIEEEGGHIDSEGNFVRAKADPDRFHDNWLEGISRKEIAAAKEAEERKRQRQRIQDREDAAHAMTKDEIYLELVNILKPSETVLEAIQRLGGSRGVKSAHATKKKSWQKSKSQQNQKSTTDAKNGSTTDNNKNSNMDDGAAAENRRLIEKVTDLSDKMMAMGHFEIYEQTYEHIVRELRKADLIADDWVIGTPVPKPGESAAMLLDDLDDPLFGTEISWEYKWANADEGQPQEGEAQVFGPFTGAQMAEWKEQGFFDQGILVRMVGDTTFEPGDKVQFK